MHISDTAQPFMETTRSKLSSHARLYGNDRGDPRTADVSFSPNC